MTRSRKRPSRARSRPAPSARRRDSLDLGAAAAGAAARDRRLWTADDALREHARLVDWFRTADGARSALLGYHSHFAGEWPPDLHEQAARWEIAKRAAADTAGVLAECAPVWCDPAMVELVAAAADTYPPGPFLEHQVPAPAGIVYFAKPLPAVWIDEQSGHCDHDQLAAVSWASGVSTSGDPTIAVVSWIRHRGVIHYAEPKLAIYYPALRSVSFAIGRYGAPHPATGGPAGPNRILQTLNALLRSPLIRETTAPGSGPARRATTRAGLPDTGVRRIALRRPEHGSAELAAARAGRHGVPPRGHWVRGHWRRQWHPSIGEHRHLWIEGYPRGDFARGEVIGAKVLIASGGHPAPTRYPASRHQRPPAARSRRSPTMPSSDPGAGGVTSPGWHDSMTA